MAEVKWVKLTTDMFDNRKIRHLRRLPEGNNIVLIWVMLLTMAGRCNSGGMIFLTENIPYTPKMLADELDFEENTVLLAIDALTKLDMIVTENGMFTIAGWEEYQNTDRLTEIREYNRIAQQKSRAKKKVLQSVNDNVNDMSMTSQRCHEIEEEEDKEKEIHSFIHSSASDVEYIRQQVVEEGFELGTHDAEVFAKEIEESMKLAYIKDDIGQGVLFISEEQMAHLRSILSEDELRRYIGIVVECEKAGKHYTNKSHHQAILDMARADRRIK